MVAGDAYGITAPEEEPHSEGCVRCEVGGWERREEVKREESGSQEGDVQTEGLCTVLLLLQKMGWVPPSMKLPKSQSYHNINIM